MNSNFLSRNVLFYKKKSLLITSNLYLRRNGLVKIILQRERELMTDYNQTIEKPGTYIEHLDV